MEDGGLIASCLAPAAGALRPRNIATAQPARCTPPSAQLAREPDHLILLLAPRFDPETVAMPPKKDAVADAWDEDWETLADVRMPLILDSIRSRLTEGGRPSRCTPARAETE